ncbi:DUF4439 domain-containing protein [Aeromicrobium sp. CF3.5]|uniref:DUF4439 domain-containing protein n=1 Tax=Aeromicrobium sp. CF3.5 TaxID=3373078 RepID=UPI003EE4EDED
MTGTEPQGRQRRLIDWLELEREATWFYPFVQARVPDVDDLARASAAAHVATRDGLLARIARDTTVARPSYDVGPLDSADDARAAARSLEQRIQAACVAVVGASLTQDRSFAIRGLRTAAVAELRWGGEARAFPGLAAADRPRSAGA